MFRNISKPLVIFFILVTIFAGIGYTVAFTMGDENRTGGVFLVQFSPMVAAIITRLIVQRNLRGFGWGWGKTRYQLTAYMLPPVIALISFSLVWVLGFGGFYDAAFVEEARVGINTQFGLDMSSPVTAMLVLFLLNGTINIFIAFGGIGEELGWRGFLVPELYKYFNFTKTALISGVIWAVFHFPLLILLLSPRLEVSSWPMMIFALVAGVALSTIMAWLRLKSGSVWTAVIFHMALNIHIQGFFQNVTIKTSWLTHYVSGEHGLMLALVSAAFAYWFWKKRDALPPSLAEKNGG